MVIKSPKAATNSANHCGSPVRAVVESWMGSKPNIR
jgi:hypothetical protein